MRVTKNKIDALKGVYRIGDWTIHAKRTRGDGTKLGQTIFSSAYKKAIIVLHPNEIYKERRTFPDENIRSVLHHEFAEIVMGAHEDVLPDKITASPAFIKYKDMLAEHWAKIVMELTAE